MRMLIFLFLFFASHLQAQENYRQLISEIMPNLDLPNAEYQILQRDLRLNTFMIESIQDIQLSGGDIAQIDDAVSNLKRTMLLASDARSVQLGERVQGNVREILESSVRPSKLKNQMQNFMRFIRNDLAKRGVNLSNYTRRFGIQVGLYYLLAMQVDYTLPLVLMASGNVKLGAAMFSTPFSSTSTALFASIRSTLRYRHMMKKLGFQATRDHFRIFKHIKRYFDRSFFGTDYLVDVNVQGVRAVLTVEESTVVSRTLNRLGYKRALSYQNLVSFLNEHNLYQDLIRSMAPETNQMKLAITLKILRQIELEGDLDTLSLLKERFGNKINMLEGIPSFDRHKNWFIKLAHSQSIDDVYKLMSQMPDNIPPKTFARVWRNYVLPSLSESFGSHTSLNHYKSFRELYNLFDQELQPLMISNNSYSLTREMNEKLYDYLHRAFYRLDSCGLIFRKPAFSIGL